MITKPRTSLMSQNHERPFPVNPLTLAGSSIVTWENSWDQRQSLVPGCLRFYVPNVQPPTLYHWPSFTLIDMEKAGMASMILSPKTSFLILASAQPDWLGNGWCYALAAGRLGWASANHLIDEVRFAEMALLHRSYLDET